MLPIKRIPCHSENCGGLRNQKIEWVVMHYTGNLNDTAERNGMYFSRPCNSVASAHYFVDENEIVLSVDEEKLAYHCGSKSYTHDNCRNENSIGVEMCGSSEDETPRISDKTFYKAAELVSFLIEKYDIPVDHIIRHYDVCGKRCPSVWMENNGLGKFRNIVEKYSFIHQISGLVQSIAKERAEAGTGFILPSVCLAQALHESKWGTSVLAKEANALFGIKANNNWTGATYVVLTKEYEKQEGFYAAEFPFRAYETWGDSIKDYYSYICENERYSSAVSDMDSHRCIESIHCAGYATDPNYACHIWDTVQEFNLTDYDSVLSAK